MKTHHPLASAKATKETIKLASELIDRLTTQRDDLLSVVKNILWCKPHKISLDALKVIAKKAISNIENARYTQKKTNP